MLKKIILISVFAISTVLAFSSNEITTWDKQSIKGNEVIYQNGKLTIDGNPYNIEDVNLMKFNITIKKESTNFVDTLSAKELIHRAEILSKKYPDSGYLVLLDEGEQRMNKDKSQYSFSRYAIKIQNEKELSNSQLSFYNRPNEFEVKLLMARSISPDGTVTYLEPSDIAYTSPNQGLQFFSGRTDTYILKATIPNVQVGSIIDYAYETIEPTPDDPNQFTTGWYFGTDMPVYQSIVTLTVPSNIPYYWAISNFEPYSDKPVIKKHDGYTSYTFTRGECAPFVEEPNCPPRNNLIPQITGSTFKDQTYLSSWLTGFFKDRMVINEEMKILVDDLLAKANASSEEQIISVLYRFVQDYVHYRSVKTSVSSGMAGHPATETFANKYGDCIDKSIFFATILNYVNVDAYPVIVMTNDYAQPPFGVIGISSGNHAINEIHLQSGKIIYLDSTSTTDKYPNFRSDDHGIKAWNPIKNTIRLIEPPTPSWNTQTLQTEITMNQDNTYQIKQSNIYKGEWESSFRYYFGNMNKAEIEGLFTSQISSIYPASKLISYNFSDHRDYNTDFLLEYTYSANNVLKNSNDYLIYTLPISTNYGETTLQTRKYPIDFHTTFGENRTITINLPKNIKLAGVPQSLQISNKFFDYDGAYTVTDNGVIFHSEYARKVTQIQPQDYEQYRKAILQIDHFIKVPILFTRDNNVR